MKQKLLSFILLLSVGISAAHAYDFSAVAPTGQTLYYNITSSGSSPKVSVTCPDSYYFWSGYSEPTGNLTIPSTVTYGGTTYSVTSIGDFAFYGCSGLTSVTIPNSVTSIGEQAFSACSGLTSVSIPNSVTSLGESAFSGCSGLTSVSIPNSVTSIGEGAFWGCSGLTSVSIPNSVTSIGNSAFYICHGLTSVTIPNSVTSIGTHAFAYCSGLTSVTIGNSVTSIGGSAFYGSGLTSVTIGNSVTSIGNSAFAHCSRLTSVTIPNSVTSIGNSAFYGCSGLTSVTIGNSVTSIGYFAFSGCNGLTSVTIPNSVISIGNHAFSDCRGLTLVTIPNSVTSIGNQAFYGCSGLTSMIIPNSVTSIGAAAFYGCGDLTSITAKSAVAPSLGNNYVFYNVPNTIPVYIPCGSSASYRSNWTYFSNFVEVPVFISVSSADSTMGGATVVTHPSCTSSTAMISATPNAGYTFTNWTEDDSVVSTDATYTFSVTDDRTLTAHFAPATTCGIGLDNLPYTDDFDSYTSSTTAKTGVQPTCWTLAKQDVSMTNEYKPMIYYASANAHSGNYSLLLNKRGIYAMPEFNGDVNTLQLSFYLKQSQTKYQLQVGVMSNLDNASTFVPVATLNNSGTGYVQRTVNFSSYTGNGHYIAFRNILASGNTGDFSCNYIDDLTVQVTPCTGIKVDDLPYADNFDHYTNSTTAKTGVEPPCWTLAKQDVSMTNEYKPMVYYSSSMAHSGNYSLILNKRGIYAMPEFDGDVNTLQLSFYLKQTQAKYQLQVGVMSNLANASSFVPVATINNSSTNSEQVTVDFSTYTGNGRYIAFRNILASGNSGDYSCNYIDDLTLDVRPQQCGISIADLPYTDNFDSYTTSTTAKTGVEPTCWTLAHQDVSMTDAYKPMIYYASANAHSGNYSLLLNKRGIYAMPEFEGNVSTLQLSMYLKQSASKYQLQVGVMSNLDNASTFVPVATINNSGTGYVQRTVNFSSYTGNGHYIAFRNILASGNTGDFSCNYIDDLTLSQPVMYTITATANPTAGGSVTGTGEYASGSTCTLTATPNTNYTFTNWTVGNTVVSTNATYSFTVTANRTLKANFTYTPPTYTVTATANPTAGGSITGAGSYSSGSTCSLTATPATGYAFSNWTSGNTVVSTNATYSFTVTANRTLTANFTPIVNCGISIDDLPYTDNFDHYTNSTTAKTGVEPPCWTLAKQDVSMTNEYKPMVYYSSSMAHSGNYSLILNKRGIYAMPEFNGGVNTLQLSFYLKQNQAKYQLQVGVMSNLTNASTFVPVATINNSSTNSEQVTVDFSSYTGNGHYIAFRNILAAGNSGDYSCNYIDDLTLDVRPQQCGISIADLPYTDNFDSYTSSTTAKTGVEPTCWTLAHQDVSMTDAYKPMIYYASANAHSSNYALLINKRGIYAMPEFEGNVSNLQLSMYLKQSATKYQLQVGVMSNLDNASTFVPVATIDNNTTGIEHVTVNFSSYTGTGHYIAFRNILASGYSGDFSCNYIDDLRLETRCSIYPDELPYTENFDGYTALTIAQTGVAPDCWTLVHQDVTMTDEYKPMIYYNTSCAHSASYSLILNKRGIYAMPAYEGDVKDLQLSFYVRQTRIKYQLQVGVMSDLSDVSTFVPLATFDNSSTTASVLRTVNFSSYTGNGHYIAFHNILAAGQTGEYSCNYIDDLTLSVAETKGGMSYDSYGVEAPSHILTLYPNPTTGKLTVDSDEDVVGVDVFDYTGRCVAVFEGQTTLDLSHLADGLYTLRITLPDRIEVRRVVKQ